MHPVPQGSGIGEHGREWTQRVSHEPKCLNPSTPFGCDLLPRHSLTGDTGLPEADTMSFGRSLLRKSLHCSSDSWKPFRF